MKTVKTSLSKDEQYMRIALSLAQKGRGKTSPNPMVGALVVKNNKIIGRGYHRCCGGAHAEDIAIARAGKHSSGAVLYVTLEPCSTYGNTPPCTDLIIASHIKKVVIGAVDPNPNHKGKGMKILKASGVEVATDVLKEEAQNLNIHFNKYIVSKLPYITVKIAMTLDGKIATYRGDSKWITNEKSRKYVHKLRSYHDAVLVGINTVSKDNPSLNVRHGIVTKRMPWKIVLDAYGRIPDNARLLTKKEAPYTIIVVTNKTSAKRKESLKRSGAHIVTAKMTRGVVDLCDGLKKLARMGITSIFVEGGSQVITSMIELGLVDKYIAFIAPKIVGGLTAPTPVGGRGRAFMRDAISLRDVKIRRFGLDIMIEGNVKYH
ncbi:MAG: bifunctional diaminohydroxyphosphoribosylaminopyrimidine deaminase/5-amino-6-(5-phosphoribosylamino)uracil reductase RibD [Candidatus Ancaeobacter aquaticus]|nr:bifunctional diaminohydroxyphosphoribosylaminopyrimidine deaminase/5-amino-6-(5-phosphoribosylamino)uracil reductase RibD [Candidatus Ancaeobacter aquaticus]